MQHVVAEEALRRADPYAARVVGRLLEPPYVDEEFFEPTKQLERKLQLVDEMRAADAEKIGEADAPPARRAAPPDRVR